MWKGRVDEAVGAGILAILLVLDWTLGPQLSLRLWKWLTTEEILRSAVGALLAPAVFWYGGRLLRRAGGFVGDQASSWQEKWSRRRIRSLLDQYVRDVDLHDKPVEISFWFTPIALGVLLFLGSSIWMLMFASIDRAFIMPSVIFLLAAWVLGMAGVDRLQRLRHMDDNEKRVQARINKLAKKRGVDDEMRRWWKDTFDEDLK
jgi:hypothetical protein